MNSTKSSRNRKWIFDEILQNAKNFLILSLKYHAYNIIQYHKYNIIKLEREYEISVSFIDEVFSLRALSTSPESKVFGYQYRQVTLQWLERNVTSTSIVHLSPTLATVYCQTIIICAFSEGFCSTWITYCSSNPPQRFNFIIPLCLHEAMNINV